MAEKRVLGLDYGARTVGVAVSDPLRCTAQPVETVTRERETKLRKTLARISELAETYQASEAVVGLPLRLDGTEGERCEKTKAFAEALRDRLTCPVHLWDERLTTVEADRVMRAGGLDREERESRSDTLAAVLILQSWLDAHPL